MDRPSWDEYFLGIVKAVGLRATCDRGRSGCVITKDNRIIATGYVGAPRGLPHCDEVGHEFRDMINPDGSTSKHCVRGPHAEQNAITQAAKVGVSLDESTMYSSMTPCYTCAKMIINCGIERVVSLNDYQASANTKRIFGEANVDLQIMHDELTYNP